MKKKTILISGANSELFKQVAKKLSKKYNLILLYHKKKPVTSKEIIFKTIQFSIWDTVEKLLKKLKNNLESIHGVIHFNGIHSFETFKTMSIKKFNEVYNINCFSFINCIKLAYNFSNLNSIIAISSVSSKKGAKGISLYSSSKSSLNNLVRSAAKELSSKNIRVNSIILGHMEYGMSKITKKFLNNEQLLNLKKDHLLGFGKIDDLYYALDFLLDKKKSRWITGTEFILDGGFLS